MSEQKSLISNAFQTFMSEAPQHAQAWGSMVQGLGNASALDKKTSALAYLAVISVLRLESGIPFHVQPAKQAGATREEIISALLIACRQLDMWSRRRFLLLLLPTMRNRKILCKPN